MITKDQLLAYFEEEEYDVTIEQIFNDLKLSKNDLNKLDYYLRRLVQEGVIRDGFCSNETIEYNFGQ